MDEKNKKPAQNANSKNDDNYTQQNMSVEGLDKTFKEAEKERTRKPGSQSNSSGRRNNGRGGGK